MMKEGTRALEDREKAGEIGLGNRITTNKQNLDFKSQQGNFSSRISIVSIVSLLSLYIWRTNHSHSPSVVFYLILLLVNLFPILST